MRQSRKYKPSSEAATRRYAANGDRERSRRVRQISEGSLKAEPHSGEIGAKPLKNGLGKS